MARGRAGGTAAGTAGPAEEPLSGASANTACSIWCWYQRGSVRYECRSAARPCSRSRNWSSTASSASRATETAPSSFSGSPSNRCQRFRSISAKRSWLAGCQDQRRFRMSAPSGWSGSGNWGRTVNRRRAFTDANLSGRPPFANSNRRRPEGGSNNVQPAVTNDTVGRSDRFRNLVAERDRLGGLPAFAPQSEAIGSAVPGPERPVRLSRNLNERFICGLPRSRSGGSAGSVLPVR